MKNVSKCFCGQLLAIVLGVAIFYQDKLSDANPPPFYFIFIYVHLIILVVSSIQLAFSKNIKRKRPKFYIYVLPALLDFIGGVTLNKSLNGCTDYLIALITQFIYPMSVIAEILFLHKNSFDVKKMGAFIILCLVCFGVNRFQDEKTISYEVNSLLFAVFSNVCYMTVVFLEDSFLMELDATLFLRDFALIEIFAGITYTAVFEYKDISFKNVVNFYKKTPGFIVAYAVPMSIFYIFAPRYIDLYGGKTYNASIITESVYMGFLHMFRNKDFNALASVGFVICIAASVILVSMEKKESPNPESVK